MGLLQKVVLRTLLVVACVLSLSQAASAEPCTAVKTCPDFSNLPNNPISSSRWVTQTVAGAFASLLYESDKGLYNSLRYANGDPSKDASERTLVPVKPDQILTPEQSGASQIDATAGKNNDLDLSLSDVAHRLPRELTYAFRPVVILENVMTGLVTALWSILLVWGIFRSNTKMAGVPFNARAYFTRLILVGIAILFATTFIGRSIDFANELSAQILAGAGGVKSAPSILDLFNSTVVDAAPSAPSLNLQYVIPLTAYTASFVLLTLALFVRVLLVDALFIFAPLALFLATFDETRSYFQQWAAAFLGLLISVPIVSVVLHMAGIMLGASSDGKYLIAPNVQLLLASGAIVVVTILCFNFLRATGSNLSSTIQTGTAVAGRGGMLSWLGGGKLSPEYLAGYNVGQVSSSQMGHLLGSDDATSSGERMQMDLDIRREEAFQRKYANKGAFASARGRMGRGIASGLGGGLASLSERSKGKKGSFLTHAVTGGLSSLAYSGDIYAKQQRKIPDMVARSQSRADKLEVKRLQGTSDLLDEKFDVLMGRDPKHPEVPRSTIPELFEDSKQHTTTVGEDGKAHNTWTAQQVQGNVIRKIDDRSDVIEASVEAGLDRTGKTIARFGRKNVRATEEAAAGVKGHLDQNTLDTLYHTEREMRKLAKNGSEDAQILLNALEAAKENADDNAILGLLASEEVKRTVSNGAELNLDATHAVAQQLEAQRALIKRLDPDDRVALQNLAEGKPVTNPRQLIELRKILDLKGENVTENRKDAARLLGLDESRSR